MTEETKMGYLAPPEIGGVIELRRTRPDIWTWLDRASRAAVILIAIGIGVLIWQSEPDTVPASDLTPATPAPTTAPLVTVAPATPIIGYTGADATSPAAIAEAQKLVEAAHEGIGNVLHNDIRKYAGACGDECQAAIIDARDKTSKAESLLGADVLNAHTWDHDQSVAHAFWAAGYWIGQLVTDWEDEGAADSALYQLGILRDVLKP